MSVGVGAQSGWCNGCVGVGGDGHDVSGGMGVDGVGGGVWGRVGGRHRLCWTRFGRKRRVVLPSPPFAAPLRQAAAQMADQMGPFDFIHVRRGDKLRITADGKLMWPHLDRDTRPHNIHRRIRRWVPDGSSIYIASNEPQGGFFSPLEKWYNVWSSEDFEVALEGTVRNNYHLFAIELMLAEYSRKFIGTFKGESPHKYYLSVDPREGYHRS